MNTDGPGLQRFRNGRGRQRESDGGVNFDHRLRTGGNRQTHPQRPRKGRLPQHTGLSGDLRPDSGRTGLRQADEEQISSTADGRRREQSQTASHHYIYMAAEVENTTKQHCHPAWQDETDSAVPATAAQKISRCPLKKEQPTRVINSFMLCHVSCSM